MPAEPAPRESARGAVSGPVPAYLLGFVIVGIGATFAGPGLSHLRDRAGTDDGGIAIVFVAQSAGYMIGSLLAGRGLDAGRGHRRWVVAMAVTIGAVIAVGASTTLPAMIVAFTVLGIAAGLSDVSGNTLVAWSRPAGAATALNALHLCFAVGIMLSPLVVNRSLHLWDSVAGVALPLAALTTVCAVMMLPRPSPQRTRLDTVARSVASGARGRHVAAVCAFFFAYVAMEVSFASWIHSYTEQIGYGGAATATGVTTVFGVGFTLGRLVGIPIARIASPGWILTVTCVLAVAASALFLGFGGPGPMLWVVTFLFAVSVAPQYAAMMAFAEAHLALSGRNTGLMVAASGLGGLVMPWVVGQLFDRSGPDALPSAVFVLAIICAATAGVAGWMLSSAGTDERPPAMVPIA